LTDTHIYPDAEQRALRVALSAYTGVPAEYLAAGNGSDELLSLLAQLMLEPGDRILVCPPTFSMYAFYARLKHCEVINVPRRADFSLDVDRIIAAAESSSPKMIFIDAPGNPTGFMPPAADIEKLLALPTLIVLDEAYIEFANQESFMRAVPRRENLVVLRTFSKWAGLAGFRVGYGAFPKWLGDTLWQAKSPYNVTIPAMTAAVAALTDLEYLKENVAQLIANRGQLALELSRFTGLTVFPSAGNFLFLRVESTFGKSAAKICAEFKEQGILIRLFEPLNGLRVTIGKPEQNAAVLEAFKRLHDRS
jgi:histidinol-phosphate aminotransferase